MSTAQGGKIVLDKTLLALLIGSDQKNEVEITAGFKASHASRLTVAAGLACLAEAGLLMRENFQNKETEENKPASNSPKGRVSAVIVAFNGRKWLSECLRSLKEQTLKLNEIIVVDNASGDGTAEWLGQNHADVKVIRLEKGIPFAAALNRGFSVAQGDYFLALNQDVSLEWEAVARLMDAVTETELAAVASCLRLMWAPAFLNGLGNQVHVWGWGTDNFIGWLDLGEFAEQKRVPSACLAAALIKKEAWQKIGPFDEGFAMYYEDSEWCYRARLLGYEIGAAPEAVVFHALGSGAEAGKSEMSATKLENVVYGRLRFHSKLYSGWNKTVRILACLGQDVWGMAAAMIRLRMDLEKARWRAWRKWIKHPPAPVVAERRPRTETQVKWSIHPRTRIWRGMPELTWESVCCDYLGMMAAGKTRLMPEMAMMGQLDMDKINCGWGMRLVLIWEGEGLRGILRNLHRKFL